MSSARKKWYEIRINKIIRGSVAVVRKKKRVEEKLKQKNRWNFPPVLNFMSIGSIFCLTGVKIILQIYLTWSLSVQ